MLVTSVKEWNHSRLLYSRYDLLSGYGHHSHNAPAGFRRPPTSPSSLQAPSPALSSFCRYFFNVVITDTGILPPPTNKRPDTPASGRYLCLFNRHRHQLPTTAIPALISASL
ncbi:Uncharacterised protein [Neisseria zoodegmatis]|uniref:Uncharacterized protein n=1 Tax=Neisseria zoodegmatis TaxID=326523 RepID=A0A378WRQ1_9NEIS|nr:Uncharacterised protein [Neisseria zoodegmatis]